MNEFPELAGTIQSERQDENRLAAISNNI